MLPGPPPQEFSQASAVFTGTVTNITDPRANIVIPLFDRILNWLGLPSTSYYGFGYSSNALYGYRVELVVNSSWKGVSTTPVQIHTGYGGGDCGFGFVLGNQYLVYAYGPGNELGAGICSRTAEATNTAEDLAYLSTLPKLPLTPVTLVSPTFGLSIGAFAFLVVSTLFAIGIFLYARNRRNSHQQTPKTTDGNDS